VAQRLEGLRPPLAARRSLKFQGVILDVDGTLVDSNDARAFAEAFEEFGFHVPFETIRRLIGKGADKLGPELIGRYNEAVAEHKKAIFKQSYLAHLRAFPHAQDLLDRLKKLE